MSPEATVIATPGWLKWLLFSETSPEYSPLVPQLLEISVMPAQYATLASRRAFLARYAGCLGTLALADWSAEFGVPVWLPRADAEFRMRSDFEIVEWKGSAEPLPGLRVVQAGGHFPDNAVLE